MINLCHHCTLLHEYTLHDTIPPNFTIIGSHNYEGGVGYSYQTQLVWAYEWNTKRSIMMQSNKHERSEESIVMILANTDNADIVLSIMGIWKY